MAFTYEKNVKTGKIENITVNGKPVKRGFMRGFRKAQNTSYWKLIERYCVGRNPFTDVEVQLNPLEATIYNFCVAWYRRYETSLELAETPIQTYDDMKYFLLDINPDAYDKLID